MLLSEYDGENEERCVNLKKHTEKIRNLMLREIDKRKTERVHFNWKWRMRKRMTCR